MVARMQTMEPPNLRNLNNFMDAYRTAGRYILLPAPFISETALNEPIWNLGIKKSELIVRPAWEIGENDPDVMAIFEDTDPIIPKDVNNAPVLKALQRFSKRRKRKRH
jgi:hypothetical protein